MLISKVHRKVILNLRNPARIMSMIPGCREIKHRGATFVAVPHTDDNVRVLRGVGIKAPGAIRHHYAWPGRFPPFAHQLDTAEFLSLHKRGYCLNGMGSGKTISALWAFHHLRLAGQLDWCIVVSPLSTLERAWGDEIFTNLPDMNFAILHGSAKRREKLALSDQHVYVVNHDGIKSKSLLAILMTKPGRGLIIIDELGTYRNSQTDRWKTLNMLCNGSKKHKIPAREWVWGLTGTPTPNEPTDAWAQCRIVTPWTVPDWYSRFRDMVMRKEGQFDWVPRDGSAEIVHQAMQPAIRFRREDCIDLPPTTYVTRDVELTPEQATMYREMKAKFKAEFAGQKITAVNSAVQVGKLLQIVCGVAYGPNGEITIPAGPRMEQVLEIIEQSEGKVIVFVPLTGALNAIAEAITKAGYSVAVVSGQTSKTQRDTIFSDFQKNRHPHVLAANPSTMAHGLTLTAASTIIWFAPAGSETYQQANMRIVRPGQKRNTLIVRLQGSKVEQKLYRRLDGREAGQDSLLDLFD